MGSHTPSAEDMGFTVFLDGGRTLLDSGEASPRPAFGDWAISFAFRQGKPKS